MIAEEDVFPEEPTDPICCVVVASIEVVRLPGRAHAVLKFGGSVASNRERTKEPKLEVSLSQVVRLQHEPFALKFRSVSDEGRIIALGTDLELRVVAEEELESPVALQIILEVLPGIELRVEPRPREVCLSLLDVLVALELLEPRGVGIEKGSSLWSGSSSLPSAHTIPGARSRTSKSARIHIQIPDSRPVATPARRCVTAGGAHRRAGFPREVRIRLLARTLDDYTLVRADDPPC